MICPKCKKDYKDVPPESERGHFYRSDDHYYKDYRRFGFQCTNCGFIAEMITTSTGDPYRKREVVEDNTIDMFEDLDKEAASFLQFQTEVGKWADRQFPQSTLQSIVAHLTDEVEELNQAPADKLEMADILLLLMHLAHKQDIDLLVAAKEKFEIVKKRRWGIPDHRGVVKHIKEKV